jgi:sulfite exporter TauE/SafE/copper chaperone CopZ/plastocyanin domain-containing protein
MTTKTIRIGGMTCVNCQAKIEKTLKSTAGVEEARVSFAAGTAVVTYNDSIVTFTEITDAIEKLDYKVLDERRREPGLKVAGTLIVIVSLYMILRQFGMSSLASAFPLAEAGMGYGMLLVIGLVTSVHCVAMCGGINLSQCLSSTESGAGNVRKFAMLVPSVLYNGGRVISYTAVGIIVGALGSVLTVSGRFQGAVQLAAGVFMVIMGINMLGIFQGSIGTTLRRFNLRLPAGIRGRLASLFTKKDGGKNKKNPLLIGLLNGLMPCGPLQAMQLYALSTGSPVRGGISMLLFSLGTVPLMFGIGALSSALSGAAFGRAFSRRVMQIGAILVTVLGLTMFSNGWSLGGFPNPADSLASIGVPFSTVNASVNTEDAAGPVISGGVQIVNSTLTAGRYPAITVQQGIPVKWTINAPQGSVNGCNNRMIIREYGIEHRFRIGDNVIEFTPEKTGRFPYSCWMGMIRSSITVVAQGQQAAGETAGAGEPDITPVPAGVNIPTDGIVVADVKNDAGFQTVSINLTDDGFDPAILVVQRYVPSEWVIKNDSLDPGNSRLVFPAYYTQIETEQGDNIIQFMPAGDFDFSTGDNIFYGYVKVVDDINAIDIKAIKAEAGEYETLIYPDAYFDQAEQRAGCH